MPYWAKNSVWGDRLSLLDRLAGGKRGSLGEAGQVALEALDHHGYVKEMVAGLILPDPVLTARCAHVIMFVAQKKPQLVQPYKRSLLDAMSRCDQWEIRLELSKAITQLQLTADEIADLVGVFKAYLDAPQSFVRTGALQGLADLARKDADLVPMTQNLLAHYVNSGTAAMRARARKLLKTFD